MLTTLLATSLFALTPTQSLSPSERAFEAAKRLEIEGHTPDLVFMMEARHDNSRQVVSFYRVDSNLIGNRWVVRRQREGDARWGDDPDAPRMPLAWADSLSCPGVRATLQEIEDIPPMPLDVYRVGSEYGVNAPLFVGGARTTFWLAGASITSSIQMTGYHYLGDWWSNGSEAMLSCWMTTRPQIERDD